MKLQFCARFVAGVLFLIGLSGCTTPQTKALLSSPPAQLPEQVELSEVPFYPQEAHQCGPAALATVLNAGGAKVTPQDLTPQVYLPKREGSLQVEMLAATRRNGLMAFELEPQLEDVLTEVAAGSPVVVLQNVALNWYPIWHYAVVVGYDIKQKKIILRSGLERRQVLPFTTFERTWARSGHWAMLALPPGQISRTASEANYVAAAVALEKTVPPKSAADAYEAALKRWPRNLVARIGAGNVAYALGNIQLAEQHFRQATLDHPESPIAFNNLAQTLLDQQRYVDALAAASSAMSLGGPHQRAVQDTLEQVKMKMKE